MKTILKQPNGKYCLFDSIVENIICYDMNETDIIEFLTSEAKSEITERVKNHIAKGNLESLYSEKLLIIAETHGADELNKIKTMIENGD